MLVVKFKQVHVYLVDDGSGPKDVKVFDDGDEEDDETDNL